MQKKDLKLVLEKLIKDLEEINRSIDAQEKKIYDCKLYRAEILCKMGEVEKKLEE